MRRKSVIEANLKNKFKPKKTAIVKPIATSKPKRKPEDSGHSGHEAASSNQLVKFKSPTRNYNKKHNIKCKY